MPHRAIDSPTRHLPGGFVVWEPRELLSLDLGDLVVLRGLPALVAQEFYCFSVRALLPLLVAMLSEHRDILCHQFGGSVLIFARELSCF